MLSQAEVESEIMRHCRALEQNTHDLATLAMDSAHADSDYKKAHAQAFLQTSGTVGERDAQTAYEVKDEYQAKKIADALLHAAEEKGRNIRASLDALRSVNSNLRALVTN